VSVKQVSVDGRLFYTYSGKKCKDVYSPAEIKDSEELEKAIDLMMSLEEDDRKAMDFLVAVQSTVDKYSKENNVTIRDIIGRFCGKTILDISQHDEEEWLSGEPAYVMLMMSDGSTLKIYCNGFEAFEAEKKITTAFYLAEDEEDYDDDDDYREEDSDDD